MGAVTATAADDECLGPDRTMRVGRPLAEGELGWPWMRSPACSAHERPPLMHVRAIARISLGARSAVVFRPFLELERESNPRPTRYERVALPTELANNGGEAGSRTRASRAYPHRHPGSVASGKSGMRGGDGRAGHRAPAGSYPQPVSVFAFHGRSLAAERFSSAAILSAGGPPASRR